MIDAVTGDITFTEIHLKPHQLMTEVRSNYSSVSDAVAEKKNSPLDHFITLYPPNAANEFGLFRLELTFDPDNSLVFVTLCHQNDFYLPETPLDAERRTFHNSIVSKDLYGQHEFSWGEILHLFCGKDEIDYLAVFYTPPFLRAK